MISGQPEVEERVDVELVPEHVAAVGLAVEPAGRDARVVAGGVSGADLQHVGSVEAQQQLHAGLARQLHVADVPQLGPCPLVLGQRRGEVGVTQHVPAGGGQRFGDRVVVGGEQRDQLLDAHRLPGGDVEGEDLLDVVLHLVAGCARTTAGAVAAEHPGPGGLGDVDVRLPGLHLERDGLRTEGAGGDGVEVAALELAVARDHLVGHPPVERGDHLACDPTSSPG